MLDRVPRVRQLTAGDEVLFGDCSESLTITAVDDAVHEVVGSIDTRARATLSGPCGGHVVLEATSTGRDPRPARPLRGNASDQRPRSSACNRLYQTYSLNHMTAYPTSMDVHDFLVDVIPTPRPVAITVSPTRPAPR